MGNRNATASWSGYLHQGKIGVLIALIRINELLISSESLDGWKVCYENAEDFDIIHNNKVHSRHQVKAQKNAKTPNDVKDVLGVLKYKINPDTDKIKIINGERKISVKGFQICDFDDYGKPLEIEVDEDSRYLHTISEIEYFGLSNEELEELKKRNNCSSNLKYIPNPNNIKLYEYPNGSKYCPLSTEKDDDQLKMFCIDEIFKILKYNNNENYQNKDKEEAIYNRILLELDNEIREKHSLGEKSYPVLYFENIYKIVIEDNPIVNFEEYRLRKSFSYAYQEFKEELYEMGIPYTDNEAVFDKIVKSIYEMNRKDFYQFLCNIHLHDKKFVETKNLEKTGLKDVFFECLNSIEGFDINKICFYDNEDYNYVLSTLNSNRETATMQIVKNSNITNEIFENNYIINAYLEGSLLDKLSKLGSYTHFKKENNSYNWEEIDKAVDDGELFLHPQEIELISVNNAKRKLI